ncbi:MAG: PadR family transcriptional regulator [Nocardioidaceae bacterium]|nr:PadR family transcriptional regulator [Nocardioidaceae bacterium]
MYRTNEKTWAQFEPVRRQRGHGRGGHGRREFGGPPWGGPPPWVAQMFGPQWGGQPGGRGSRRARVRRGDVRGAILDVLATATEPLNGYQVIQQIAERSNGAWKPSPGSVYPTVAQLVDEGLVEDAPTGRKTLQLTETGRAYVAEHAEELAAIWATFDEEGPEDAADFRQVIQQTVAAIVQIASTGTPAQRDRAVEILAETRRKLYGLLAEGPDAAEEER